MALPSTCVFEHMGIWGQVVYVNAASGVVIVETSADPDFGTRLAESVAVVRAIGHDLAGSDHAPVADGRP